MDGTVVASGDNNYGECNVSGWKNITDISAGERHTVGLKSDGTLVAAGDNSCGQCDVSDWHDIIAVEAGTFFTIGLKADGTLAAVGNIGNKQGDKVIPINPSMMGFGCGSSYGYDVSGWKNIISINVGFTDLIGLRSDGTAVAVGLHSRQFLAGRHMAVADWCHIAAVSAGFDHVAGLKMDGTMVATGENEYGQCNISRWRLFRDINTLEEERTQIKARHEDRCKTLARIRKRAGKAANFIASGSAHVLILKLDGTVMAAGENSVGQCNVSGWENIAAVAAFRGLSAGLKSDGTVVTAGNIYSEGCRYCDTSDWTDIVRIAAVPSSSISSEGCVIGWKEDGSILSTDPCIQNAVSGQTDIVSVSKYNGRILCLKADGMVAGDSPVSGMRDIVSMCTGALSRHTVWLNNDGTVRAAGNNEFGQCGVSGWENIVAVSVCGGYTAGLKAEGTVNVLGPPAGISSMQEISGWTDIAAITAGNHFIIALKTDGTVVASGQNNYGECDISGLKLFRSLDTIEEEIQSVKRLKQREKEQYEIQQKRLNEKRQAEEAEAKRREQEAHEQSVMKAKQRIKELEQERKDVSAELENTHGIFSGKKRQQLRNKLDSIDKEIKCLQDL